MKKFLYVVLVFLFAVPVLFAQDGGGRRRGMHYDVAKEKTYTGIVAALAEQGRRGGVTFKSGGVSYRLHTGPKDWLAGKGITLKVGDTITVVGVAHTGQRGSFLNARSIKSGDKTVELRGADGKPCYPRPPRQGKGPGDKDGDGD
jgi:hypothetical protein